MEDLATLPFQVLEALDLPARYERSFKLRPGALLAQRYLLGVPAVGLAPGPLLQAAQRLGMPAPLLAGFRGALEGASTVLYGFEGTPDGAVVFKAYAEYRGRLRTALDTARARGQPAPAVELFRGFKWCHGLGNSGVQTVYTALPGLAPARLHALADRPQGEAMQGAHGAAVRGAARGILGHALAACPGCTPLWLDIAELGRPVRAFDLNLYDAGLRVADAAPQVTALAQALGVDAGLVQRLLAVAGQALLGHLSAGLGRDGQPYLALYFEP
jgi:hypothetical protein